MRSLFDELAHTSEDQSHRRAVILHELGRALAVLPGRRSDSVRHYLEAYNADPTFRPPLQILVEIFERRRAHKNLGRLYAAERRTARDDVARGDALLSLAELAAEQDAPVEEVQAMLGDALAADPTSTAAAIALERVARQSGDHTDIRAALEARIAGTVDPSLRAVLRIDLARVLEAEGEIDAALSTLDESAKEDAARFRVLSVQERMARRHGRHQALVDALEARALLAEAAAEGHDHGRTGLFSVQRFEDSTRATREAGALLYEAARVRGAALGDAAGGFATLERAMALLPDDSLLQYEHMLACERRGDLEGARTDAESLLALGVDGVLAAALHYRRALAARASGDVDAEREALRAALDNDPGSAPASSALAELLARENDHEARVQLFEGLAKEVQGPGHSELYWRAGQIAAESLGEFDRARPLYERAALTADNPTPVLRELYGAALRAGRADAASEVSAALIERGLELTEHSVLLRERFELLMGPLEQTDEAHKLLAEALADPACNETAPWAANAARIEAALSGDDALLARAHLVLARDAAPEVASAHLCAAGRALIRLGDSKGAEDTLREALSNEPGNPYAVALLEELLRDQGRADEVVHLLREAADAQRGARAEMGLLHAGAAAESAGDKDLAADAFRDAASTTGGSGAGAWALERLALASDDEGLREEALRLAAEREADTPGVATLRAAEYQLFDKGDPATGADLLAGLLGRPSGEGQEGAGAALRRAAAVAALLMPREAASAARELVDNAGRALAHGADGDDPLLSVLLPSGPEAANPQPASGSAAEAIADTGEVLSDDGAAMINTTASATATTNVWEAVAHLDRALSVLAQNGGVSDESEAASRADAWRALGRQVEDPVAKRELLLHATRARLASGARDAVDDAFLLAQELIGAAPDSVQAAVALDETLNAGDDADSRARALAGRLPIAGPRIRSGVQGAHARSMLAAGRGPDAVDELLELVEKDPEDLASWETLRVAAREARRFELVVDACDKLSTRLAGEFQLQLLEEAAATLMDYVGDDERAQVYLERVLELDLSRPIAFWRMHDLLTERGEAGSAELLDLITRRIPLLDEPDEVPETGETELSKLYYGRARLLRAAGNKAEAAETLANLLLLDEKHAGGLALNVEIAVGEERWEDAVHSLRALATADVPASQQRVARLGAADFLEKKLGRPQDAMSELRVLARTDGADHALLARIADIAIRAGDTEEAVAALQEAQSRSSDETAAGYLRRAAALVADSGDAARAASLYRGALGIVPTDVEAGRALADLLPVPERRQHSASFESAVRKGMATDGAPQPNDLRKLVEAASWRDDRDLSFCVMQALLAMGVATREEREAADEHTSIIRRVRATQPVAQHALNQLDAAHGLTEEAAFVKLVGEWVGLAVGPAPAHYGVGRGELLSSRKPSHVRDELSTIATAFGVTLGEFYVGGNDAARVAGGHGKKAPFLVVGAGVASPLDTPRRFHAGRQLWALATGSHPVMDRSPAEGADLLMAAAAAADAPLAASAGRAGLVEVTRAIAKVMPRKVRKAAAEAAQALPGGGRRLEAYCAAAQLSASRAGLLVSGDVSGTLGMLVGGPPTLEAVSASPITRDLISFWVSPASLMLRRDLGLSS